MEKYVDKGYKSKKCEFFPGVDSKGGHTHDKFSKFALESLTDHRQRYLRGHEPSSKHTKATRELEGTLLSFPITVSKPALSLKISARAKVELLLFKYYFTEFKQVFSTGKKPVPLVLDIRQNGKSRTVTSSRYTSLHLNYYFIIYFFQQVISCGYH